MIGDTYRITRSFDEKSYAKAFSTRAVTHNLSQKSQVCAKRMSQSYHSRQIHTKMTKMMFVKKNQVRLFITYDHNFFAQIIQDLASGNPQNRILYSKALISNKKTLY